MKNKLLYIHRTEWASQVALEIKNMLANAGDIRDMSSIPGSGRSPGGGPGKLFQDSRLENPMDGGAWRATGHRVSELDTTAVTQRAHMYSR